MVAYETGPEADEERPLRDHLTELRRRTLVCLAVVGAVAAVAFPLSNRGIALLVETFASAGAGLAVYSPIEYVVVQVYFSLAIGLAVGTPVIIYEAYAFMAPGLYADEKRFYLLTVPVSAALLAVGAALAWFVVLPQLAPLLTNSGQGVVTAAISIDRIFFFTVGLVLSMGAVFQVPIAVALSVWSGVASADTLLDNRLYVYGSVLFLTSVITVDPTMASQLVLTAVFVVLYEASVRAASRLT